MTKFSGDAVASRAGKSATSYTSKDLRKNMAKFLETGVHPDIERARQDASTSRGVVPLPDLDINRPFVFMDISIDGKPAGRVVIELFEDLAPAAAKHLQARCLPGATGSLSGARIHKLVRHYAAFAGKSAAAGQGVQLPTISRLKHLEAGAVSVSRDGTEFAISLAKAQALDATHQVVGRVHMGKELLDQLNDTPTLPDDAPVPPIKITKCGATNSSGAHESLGEALETAAQTAARLQQESKDTRSAIMEALQEGMGNKRKAPDDVGPRTTAAGSNGAGAGAAHAKGAGGRAAGGRNVKSKMLDSLLGDLDEDEEGSEEGSL